MDMFRLSDFRPYAVSLLILFSVLLIAAVPASAAFDYTGVVHYENGTPVEGANVSLEQVGSNTVYSNISNASGHFNVSGVPTGNSYGAKVRLRNSDGNVTHTSKNVPDFPGRAFSNMGDVNYYLRPAVTMNVTAADPTEDWGGQITNGTGNDLSSLNTSLEILTDEPGKPYVYINESGNLTKVNSTTRKITENSTNTIPNISGATALTYNGSGGYYAANNTKIVKFKNDSNAAYNLTHLDTWKNNFPSGYEDVQGLEYRNEGGYGYVYVSYKDTGPNPPTWHIDKLNTSDDTLSSAASGRRQAKLEYNGGNWYLAKNNSGRSVWEIEKLDSDFNYISAWEFPQGEKVRGFEYHSDGGWNFTSINTGTDKGSIRKMALPDPTVKSFNYQVKDTKLGYPVATKFSGSVEQESIVLPANRNYGIEMHPTSSMPTSKSVKNIKENQSWKQNRKIDVRFNVSEKPLWIEGYANTTNTSMGSPGFDNFTVVPYLLETGRNGVPMTFKQDPHQFPRNLSAIRQSQEADNFTASEGYYNITQIGSAETSRILLFYTAYNTSENNGQGQYYGGFSDLSLNATQDDVTGQNVTLQPLKGSPDNITTQAFDSNFALNNVDVPTSQRNFTIQNESGSPKSAHVEARVNYSTTFSNLDTAFTWLTSVGTDGNFSIPILNTSVEEVNVYPNGGDAPKKTSLEKSRIQNSPVLINVSKIQPGSPDGSPFGDIDVDMYKSDTDTNVPNPNESKSLIKGDIGNFSPLTAILGGGDLSFRMTKTSSNITVHYVDTDLLASGPPDALFDDNSSTSETDGSLKEAWRFGSEGPEIYDHVLLGMPYNASNHPDDADFTVEIGKFYDDDWNVIWNASTNTTSEVPSHYDAYTDPKYKGYIDGSGITASKTDPNSTVYVNTSSNMVWMQIPHFSGISPSISSQPPSTTTTPSTSGSSSPSPPSLGDGTIEEQYQKITYIVTQPGEPAEVEMPEGSPVKNLRVTTNKQSIDPSFAAGEHSEKPSDVSDPSDTRSVQKYISITTSIPDEDIDSAEIDFSVEQSWLDENGFERDEVILMRYSDDQWQDLETEFLGEADGELEYSAQSPGFSVFAVSGEKKTVEETASPTPTETETETPGATETATPTETPTPEETIPGFTWVAGLTAFGAALFSRTRRA